ncbi:MAG: hypothetical protein ACXVRJ_00585 [Gaiellaceae bacterium]
MRTETLRDQAQLRHRRNEVTRRRDKAVERVALFPNPVNRRHVEELTAELAEIDRRLAEAGAS